jgi:hypothetical protein
MCMRDRPTLVTKQIGIYSVVVGSHPSTPHIPHSEIGRVDLGDDTWTIWYSSS